MNWPRIDNHSRHRLPLAAHDPVPACLLNPNPEYLFSLPLSGRSFDLAQQPDGRAHRPASAHQQICRRAGRSYLPRHAGSYRGVLRGRLHRLRRPAGQAPRRPFPAGLSAADRLRTDGGLLPARGRHAGNRHRAGRHLPDRILPALPRHGRAERPGRLDDGEDPLGLGLGDCQGGDRRVHQTLHHPRGGHLRGQQRRQEVPRHELQTAARSIPWWAAASSEWTMQPIRQSRQISSKTCESSIEGRLPAAFPLPSQEILEQQHGKLLDLLHPLVVGNQRGLPAGQCAGNLDHVRQRQTVLGP